MANVTIDIDLVTKAFNQALKQSSDQVKGFQVQFEKTQKGVNSSFKKIDSQAKKTNQGFTILRGTIASFLGNLASTAVTSFVNTIQGLGQSVVDGALRFEQLSVQFEVLTGSAESAQAVLKDLTEFAATTPFQLGDIADAGAQLIGFQIPATEVRDRLQEIGDVAAAANKPIGDIAQIFGQVQAAGKLTGERLLQFQERAIPIGPAIAKTLGVAETAVKDLVSEGRVTADVFNKAFASLSQAGGPAFEGLIKQSTTLGGLISTLKDNFTLLQVEVGNALLPVLKELAITTLSLIQSNKDFILSLGLKAVRAFTEAVAFTVNVFNLLLAAVDAVVLGFDGLKFLFSATFSVMLQVAESAVNLGQALLAITGADPSPTLEKISSNLNLLKQSSIETTGQIQSDIAERIDSREKEGEALQNFADKLRESVNVEEQAEADKTALRKEAEAKELERAKQAELSRLAAIKEIQDQFKEEENIIKAELEIAETEDEIAKIEKIRENELAKIDIIRDAELEKANLIQNSVDKTKAIETAEQKARLAALKVNGKARIDTKKAIAAEENQIAQGQLTASRNFLQAGLLLAKQGSKEQKALSIADATINTYAAATRAYKDYPYPANIAVMASTIALGLAQVAKISSAGNFAQGGIVPGTSFAGDNLTANVNSGELILNRGQQQRLLNIANGNERINSQGMSAEEIETIVRSTVQNLQVTLEANDVEIARSVSRGVDQGIVIGSN